MKTFLKSELESAKEELKFIDSKVLVIFLSVAVLQTISWYFTSRQFFRDNFPLDFFSVGATADLFEFIYWFLGDFIVLFILPLLIIKYFLKESIPRYGLKLGKVKIGLKYFISFSVIILIAAWFLSTLPAFSENSPFLQIAKENWVIFIVFEIGALIYMFAWEFIWRGFMLFGLEAKYGMNAIIIQMLPFVILHNGKPFVETISSIVGALLLGYIALRTRSIIYGVLIHFILFFSMDLFSTIRFRTNDFAIGINSLTNFLVQLF